METHSERQPDTHRETFLCIYEDGSLGIINTITDDERDSVSNGTLDILRFHDGMWQQLSDYGTSWELI